MRGLFKPRFTVSLVDDTNFSVGVTDPPPQCKLFEQHRQDPFATGPGGWLPASMECRFVEEIAVL